MGVRVESGPGRVGISFTITSEGVLYGRGRWWLAGMLSLYKLHRWYQNVHIRTCTAYSYNSL